MDEEVPFEPKFIGMHIWIPIFNSLYIYIYIYFFFFLHYNNKEEFNILIILHLQKKNES